MEVHPACCACPGCDAPVEIEENQCFRFSFQVPEFSKSGKLMGHHLEHIARCNVISTTDFRELYQYDVARFLKDWNGVEGSKKRLAETWKLTPAQTDLMRYTGVSVAKCAVGETIPSVDERWI